MLWFYSPWCSVDWCFYLLVPGMWAGHCTSSCCRVVDLLGFSFCWSPFYARDVGVYCSFVGLDLLLFGFGLCPGCGLWLVHCFFSFCCVSVCPDVGLGFFNLFIRSSLVRAVALSLFLGEVLPVFLLGWVALPP